MPQTDNQLHLRQVFDDGLTIRFRITDPAEYLTCKLFLAQLRKEGVKFSKVLDVTEQAVLVFKPAEE